MNTGDGRDHTYGDDTDERHKKTVDDDGRGGKRWEGTDAGETATHGGKQDREIPPVRNFWVSAHETHVDIVGKVGTVDCLATPDQSLEADGEFVSVEQDDVGESSSVYSEEEDVNDGVSSSEIRLGVGLVLFIIEDTAFVDDFQNLIPLPRIVESLIRVDGEVCGVVRVGPPETDDDKAGDEHPSKVVKDREDRGSKRVKLNSDLVPVKGVDGVEAQTRESARDGGQDNVLRSDPSHPVEVGEILEDESGEPEVSECQLGSSQSGALLTRRTQRRQRRTSSTWTTCISCLMVQLPVDRDCRGKLCSKRPLANWRATHRTRGTRGSHERDQQDHSR